MSEAFQQFRTHFLSFVVIRQESRALYLKVHVRFTLYRLSSEGFLRKCTYSVMRNAVYIRLMNTTDLIVETVTVNPSINFKFDCPKMHQYVVSVEPPASPSRTCRALHMLNYAVSVYIFM